MAGRVGVGGLLDQLSVRYAPTLPSPPRFARGEVERAALRRNASAAFTRSGGTARGGCARRSHRNGVGDRRRDRADRGLAAPVGGSSRLISTQSEPSRLGVSAIRDRMVSQSTLVTDFGRTDLPPTRGAAHALHELPSMVFTSHRVMICPQSCANGEIARPDLPELRSMSTRRRSRPWAVALRIGHARPVTVLPV